MNVYILCIPSWVLPLSWRKKQLGITFPSFFFSATGNYNTWRHAMSRLTFYVLRTWNWKFSSQEIDSEYSKSRHSSFSTYFLRFDSKLVLRLNQLTSSTELQQLLKIHFCCSIVESYRDVTVEIIRAKDANERRHNWITRSWTRFSWIFFFTSVRCGIDYTVVSRLKKGEEFQL